jgi:hypothetical protein
MNEERRRRAMHGRRLQLGLITVGIITTVVTMASAAGSRAIVGLVTDKTNSPLPNVLVELKCSRNGKLRTVAATRTNDEGRFRLQFGSPQCKIRISAPGFASRLVSLDKPGKDEAIDLGKIVLDVSCSGPGVVCDEVTPRKATPKVRQPVEPQSA